MVPPRGMEDEGKRGVCSKGKNGWGGGCSRCLIDLTGFEIWAVRNVNLIGVVVFCCEQSGHLAMETLLSLTSKRAGDWFKEELRLLGGLDHIVDKGVCVCVRSCVCSCVCACVCVYACICPILRAHVSFRFIC